MLQVVGLDGSSLELCGPTTGLELRKRLREAFPLKKGAALALYAGPERKSWDLILEPQLLSCVYLKADVHAAWRFLQGLAVPQEDIALEGVTQIEGLEFEEQLVDLPNTVEVLSFRSGYNQSITVELPDSLQELTFGYHFNKPLGVSLPDELLTLRFGDHFNESLAALPLKLRSLTFGQHFNQRLDHLEMPSSLESLAFGFDFNQRLPAMPQLQHLVLGASFDQALGLLPKLLSLTWPEPVLQVADVPQVEHLVSIGWPGDGIASLPLQSLDTGTEQSPRLPDSLQELTLRCEARNLHLNLPAKLRSLSFKGGFSPKWDSITLPSIEALTCSRNCGQLPPLPPSLERLEVGGLFNESLGMAWPPLRSLTLGFDFNHALTDATLPSTLKSLTFGCRFDQPLVNLPTHLEILVLGHYFNKSLEKTELPETLHTITFGRAFDKVDEVRWPHSLSNLTLHGRVETAELPQGLRKLCSDGLTICT